MINEIISEIRIYIINFVYIPYGLEWQGRGFELAPCPLPINSKPLYRFLLNREKEDKMIKLGDLLKLIEPNDLTVEVYVRVRPYECRRIRTNKLPNYANREVTSISFDAVGYEVGYEDCNPELYVCVNIAGLLLEEDRWGSEISFLGIL